MAGVYGIMNLKTSRIYIGQTIRSFGERWFEHRWELDRGRHWNRYLQASWKNHTPQAFKFMILEIVDDLERLPEAETFWLKFFPLHYNFVEEEFPVRSLSFELRQQISRTLTGRTTGRSVTGGQSYDEFYGVDRSLEIRTKQSLRQIAIKNRPPPVQKGSTYEERYGPERAREEREKRRQGKLRTHRSRK